MASLSQHNSDCERFLGQSFENVNRWIDEYFTQYGPTHRKFRHHREGVEQARDLFGDRGSVAAAIHILRDCRHIPRKQDYELGYVDALGLKANWSTASYIKYSEEDFTSLVEQLLKPSGVVLWSFIDLPALQLVLNSLTRFDPQTIQQLSADWQKAKSNRESLPPLTATEMDHAISPIQDPAVSDYVRELEEKHPTFKLIAPGKEVSVVLVELDRLITPLVLLDYELIDSLKPELPFIDEIHVARFALPTQIAVAMKAMVDPTMRSAIFVSNDKSLTASPAQVQQTPLGTAITFMVGASGSALVVASNSGRLILRNGIHRAFLLASMGVKSAPCVLVKEEGPIFAPPTQAYPTFADAVLAWPRPPMLTDFQNPDLTLQAPMQRTRKLIKIWAEETIIPID
jgi:hypothetical protein